MLNVPSSVVSENVAHLQVENVEVLATREPSLFDRVNSVQAMFNTTYCVLGTVTTKVNITQFLPSRSYD